MFDWKKRLGAAASLVAVAAGCSSASDTSTSEVSVDAFTGGVCVSSAYGKGCSDPPPNLDIPMNGLPTWALEVNLLSTNVANSQYFTSHPLAGDTIKGSTALQRALYDDGTRMFLRYVARCALAPSQTFSYPADPKAMIEDPNHVKWRIDETGRAGLCPEWGGAGTGPWIANKACQQRVSACLLAENNPLGKHVPISLRGQIEAGAEPLRNRVPTLPMGRKENDVEGDDLLAEFLPCTGPAVGRDVACGWNRKGSTIGYAGLCAPGDTVTVALGSSGAPWTATALRVCEGAYGCTAAANLAEASATTPGTYPSVSFVCPTFTEPKVPQRVFSVMTAGYDRSVLQLAKTVVTAAKAVVYPADEQSIFGVREGAFFGNLFDTSLLAASAVWDDALGHMVADPNFDSTRRLGQPVYGGLYSCSAPGFTQSSAHILSRVCAAAVPGSRSQSCIAQPLGDCTTICGKADATGAYAGCGGYPALTTFLHSSWDVMGQGR